MSLASPVDAGNVVFCASAGLVSLSLLVRCHGATSEDTDGLAVSWLGGVLILGWAWASVIVQETELALWVVSLTLALMLKRASDLPPQAWRNPMMLGGLALLPVGVQLLV